MRVLFVPAPKGWLAHLIPMVALNRLLQGSDIETAFLVPRKLHRVLNQAGINVLDIDYNDGYELAEHFRLEVLAYGKYNPDVVVDDTNPTTRFATSLSKLPRITIHRYGMFPGSEPRLKHYQHSNDYFCIDVRKFPDVTSLGLQQPKEVNCFFKADIKIVPGIRSIEVLPEHLKDDDTYFYSGPLLLDDHLVQQHEQTDVGPSKDFDPLRRFFDSCRDRPIVFATLGTTVKASSAIFDCINYMLENGIAVVSSIQSKSLVANRKELYYFAPWLPLHFVCSHVDLMIHQSSSGTYQYPIICELPGITVGSRFYDQEDIALRLQEMGVSVHLPSPEEFGDFPGMFRATIEKYFDHSTSFYAEKKQRLKLLHAEAEQTSAAFNFQEVLARAVSRTKRRSHSL